MSVQLKTPVRTAPPAARRLVVPLGGDVDDGQFSLLFDGASGAIQMGTAPAIMPAGSLSLACWVKFLGIGTNQHIMGRGQGLGGPSPFTLTLFGTSGNLVYFDLTNDAGTRATANSTTVFTTGRWYHLAATWDGTAGVGGVKLYVNGALDAQATSPFAAPTASTMNFTLGNYYNSGWGTWWLNGLLGEPRVYGRQLSAAEITALYQSGVAPAGPLAE